MIKVLQSGFYSTIQDFGRYGYQDYGVPYSGVMDRYACTMANTLLGNPKEAPVLEITMTGPTLEFCVSTMFCVSGAEINPTLNGSTIKNNKAIAVKAGDILSFGKLINGYRAYLAVFGGFQTEYVMDSYSMYKGVTTNTSIVKGDELEIEAMTSPTKNHHAVLRVNTSYLTEKNLPVFIGPEFDKLTESQQKVLLTKIYTVSKNNNRMAYQLEELLENMLEPITTSPVLPGTVQLTPSGQLIVLMRDCQTTGGYPRVLQLKASAIEILSQKLTGEPVVFKLIKM
ncbi:5-oxoprolinase subunit C family protein [Aestuariivivens marinum]|uniref:5-oxoprolinase subunit C family protein n=1 Tax=Aestuariivivens marinum TaxID=2913555 RepID=UPI001F593675|nr:biotin-dependent carboxyltransferase family protein [Aestuariivivens marinum]